jgi:DnaJ-class molecular chaperone
MMIDCKNCNGTGRTRGYLHPVEGWQVGSECQVCQGKVRVKANHYHQYPDGYIETDPFCQPTLNADSDFN